MNAAKRQNADTDVAARIAGEAAGAAVVKTGGNEKGAMDAAKKATEKAGGSEWIQNEAAKIAKKFMQTKNWKAGKFSSSPSPKSTKIWEKYGYDEMNTFWKYVNTGKKEIVVVEDLVVVDNEDDEDDYEGVSGEEWDVVFGNEKSLLCS